MTKHTPVLPHVPASSNEILLKASAGALKVMSSNSHLSIILLEMFGQYPLYLSLIQ